MRLSPVAGVVDRSWVDVEPAGELVSEMLGSSELRVCGESVLAVGYYTDSDGLGGAVPGSAWYHCPLPLPFLRGLDLAVFSAEAVANNEVAIDEVGRGKPGYRGKLVDITGRSSAEVNLDAVPSVGRLSCFGENDLFDGVESIISRETERAG